jgi:hypothetical protein
MGEAMAEFVRSGAKSPPYPEFALGRQCAQAEAMK